jgi:hypothetical protein
LGKGQSRRRQLGKGRQRGGDGGMNSRKVTSIEVLPAVSLQKRDITSVVDSTIN